VLDVERWAELRREHFVRGVGIKELVRRTGLSRNTVRAALRSDEPPVFRCPERPSKLDPFKDEIHRLLKDDPMLSGVRVREEIEPLGSGRWPAVLGTRTIGSPRGRHPRRGPQRPAVNSPSSGTSPPPPSSSGSIRTAGSASSGSPAATQRHDATSRPCRRLSQIFHQRAGRSP